MRCWHVGTSGWHDGHRVGPFYPPATRGRAFLAPHRRQLAAAEIVGGSRRMPSAATLASWRDAVPSDFRFAIEASRVITHATCFFDNDEAGHAPRDRQRLRALLAGRRGSAATARHGQAGGRNA